MKTNLRRLPVASGRTELRRGALGVSTLFFATATAIAPLTAALLGVPLVVLGAGWAAPAAFLVAAAMLAVFAVGYVEMARRVRSAGGFYTFVSEGFGRVAGLGTASVVTMAYGVFTASLIGAFAFFAGSTVESWTGTSIPVWALLAGALVANVAFAYFEVRITARVLGVFFVAELVGLLVFAVVVLAQGGAEGLTAAPLNPLAILDNEGAIAVFGAAAPGIALYSAFSSWLGFEMAPSYSEETRSRRGVAWVTLGTLLAMTVVYVLVSYAFVVGYGSDGAAAGVASQFGGEVASAFYPLTDRYAGSGLTHAFELLIVTSLFAAQLAVFNVAARYLFALGRDGVLPRALGRTHGRLQTPHVAERRAGARARALHRRLPARRRQPRGGAAQARHLELAAGRPRRDRRAGTDVVRDRRLLPPDPGQRPLAHARRPARRRRPDALLGVPRPRQPRDARGRPGHPVRRRDPLDDRGRLHRRSRRRPLAPRTRRSALPGGRTRRGRGDLAVPAPTTRRPHTENEA